MNAQNFKYQAARANNANPAGTALDMDNFAATMKSITAEDATFTADTTVSDIVAGKRFNFTAAATVAAAGSIQGDATALDSTHSFQIVTGADGAKGVLLPLLASGNEGICREVYNAASSALKIYPNTSDTINGGSADTAITVPPRAHVLFRAVSASDWAATIHGTTKYADIITEITAAAGVTVDGTLLKDGGVTTGATGRLALGYVATLAGAGTIQGDAAAVVAQVTFVTGSDGTVGVVLPGATAGAAYTIYNTVSAQNLKVYPASGDDINDGTTNVHVNLAGKAAAIFVGLDTTTWLMVGNDASTAFTQTYSTADATHSNPTQQTATAVANVAGATENYEFQDTSATVTQAEARVFLKTIQLLFEQVRADIIDNKGMINSIVDLLQANKIAR